MTAVITLDRNMNKRQIAAAAQARPRNPSRIAGGYIADMVALRTPLIFCGLCVRKFDSAKYGYVAQRSIPFVRGKCDGCKEFGERQHFLFHKDAIPR